MNLSDLNNLEFANIGNWPALPRFALVLLLCAAIGGSWFYLDTKEQYAELDRHRAEESKLKYDFENKQAKAVNLEAHKEQLVQMRKAFGAMLRQLPEKSEVANLLIDVSQAGLASGLEFELFQPQAVTEREFYVELPVSLRVIGDYHEFGEFISALASMPRILTMHNVNISRRDNQTLVMNAIAKTYYYTDETGSSATGGGL